MKRLAIIGVLVALVGLGTSCSKSEPQPKERTRTSITTTAAPTTATTASPQPPTFSLACPHSGTVDSPSFYVRFSHSPITASAPLIRFDIDYGDGNRYASQTEAAVFEHRYGAPGTFTVTAVVTDANGRQGSSSCRFFWNRPSPTSSPTSTPSSSASSTDGATAICNDGSLSYSQHRRGTCSHHGGAREWHSDMKRAPPGVRRWEFR